MERQRNKRYYLSDLLPGDRFYFVGGRKKNLYTVAAGEPHFKKKQAGFWITYCRCTELDNTPIEFKSNRLVIFLRNINEPINRYQ